MINKEFPFTPKRPDDGPNDAWSKLPDVKPQRFHIFYRLLDGDSSGRPAKHPDGSINPDFQHRSQSGLCSVVHGPFKEVSLLGNIHHRINKS